MFLLGSTRGLRYAGSSSFYRLVFRNFFLVLLFVCVSSFLSIDVPRTSWILLWFLLTGFTGAIRFALRDVLLSFRAVTQKKALRVAIYGAGAAGAS